MFKKRFAPYTLGLLLLAAGASADPSHHGASPPVASAILHAADGSPAGTATLLVRGKGLELHLDARGLPEGEHGAHIHAVGSCEAPGFASAGSHLNPFGKVHGMMNPQGHHLGDLPNLVVGPDGTGTLTVQLEGKQAEIEPFLFDSDGAAIVIHATADDLRSDPSGNSGSRLVCGVLEKAG